MDGSISRGNMIFTRARLHYILHDHTDCLTDHVSSQVMDGSISRGNMIESYASREKWEIQELGILAPNRMPQQTLYTGQVGYVITGIKVGCVSTEWQ